MLKPLLMIIILQFENSLLADKVPIMASAIPLAVHLAQLQFQQQDSSLPPPVKLRTPKRPAMRLHIGTLRTIA